MSNGALQRDANFRTVDTNEAFLLESTWTFSPATTGSVGTHTIFTATGNCLVSVFAICDSSLTSGGVATAAVGVAGNTAGIIAQTTATDINDGDVWVNATPGVGVQALPSTFILNDGADIILTIGTDTLTGGSADFYCTYRPLSSGAVVSATTPA
jgi:hypothetical protein